MSFESLVEVLQRRARENPDLRAFTYLRDGERDEAVITYAELDTKARAIAGMLRSCTRPGDRAVLLYPPGIEYIAAFFGSLYAGVIAVPAYPPDPSRLARTLPRLQAIVADAGAQVVLTTSLIVGMLETVSAIHPELGKLRWTATDTLPSGLADEWRSVEPAADALAFLQYTSGSTGTPKGVMLTHGNLIANERAIQKAFALGRTSVGVGWLPLYHDMGLIGNVLQTVFTGFHCVLMSPLDFLARPVRWLEAISRYRGTTSGGPNFAFDLVVRRTTDEDRARLNLDSWSVAFCGAEPVRSQSLERFAAAFAASGFDRRAFLPCYGLAEATLLVTGKPASSEARVTHVDANALTEGRVVALAGPSEGASARELVSCGPSADGDVRIVDPTTRKPVADGQVGEIWISGPSVAVGYWRASEATEATFLTPPSAPATERFLRSGDVGFVLDGELYVTGRLKDLIIVRGRNYYPQDIEQAVEELPQIRQGASAAFSVESEGEERVVVVAEVARTFAPDSDTAPLAAAIRRSVHESCQLHLHAIVLVRPGEISKTSSGKVQRHACKTAYLDGTLAALASNVAADDAPVSVVDVTGIRSLPPEARGALVEQYLASQLARVTRTSKAAVDLDAPLATVGLDSLMAVDVSHAVERDLAIALPITSFLRDTTGRALAASITASLEGSASLAHEPAVEAMSFPLSAGQEALWFLQELVPEATPYNIGTAFTVRGPVVASALEAAFDGLLQRHRVLTATASQDHGSLAQRVQDAPRGGLTVIDAAGWSDDDLARCASDLHNRPFDLARGPLFRARLFSRSQTEHVLVLSAHHFVADLWSLVTLLEELRTAYAAAVAGADAPSAPASARYQDFVAWQRTYLARDAETDWSYWRGQLEGAPALELPTDRPRPPVQRYVGGAVPLRLSDSLCAAIGPFAKREGTTPYNVLLTCFEILLARYSQQTSFLVGTPVVGRPGAAFDRTVGYFVNTVPLRADLSSDPTVRDLLRRNREVVLGALEHQHFPFSESVRRAAPDRDRSRAPLFQSMFVLEKANRDEESDLAMLALGSSARMVDFAGLELGVYPLEHRTARVDFSLSLAQGRDGIHGYFEYDTDLFERETVERAATHFETLLAAVLERPETTIWQLPLMPESELRRVLVEWQGARVPVSDKCIHELFEEQAARTPDALATEQGDVVLRFADLNRRANQLARWLRHRGVGVESRVVVWFERSPTLTLAALAVLKAGATYVPMDPSAPAARVAFTVRDAGAQLVLSSRAVHRGQTETPLVCIDDPDVAAEIDREPTDNLGIEMTSAAAMYVIYTSGTTGEPNGVIIEHRQFVSLVEWVHRTYALGTSDRISQTASPAFDAAVWEIWPALLAGASLHPVTDEERLAPDGLRQWVVDHGITLCFLPTPLAEQFLEEEDWEGTSLRWLVTGGDRLTRRPNERHPFEFTNGYGPCECTVQATMGVVERGAASRAPSIGHVLDNCSVYVLDSHLEPVPIGIPGELFIGGKNVGRGYLNRPELTERKFLRDPFAAEPDARMYRTGDMGRFLPDGTLDFVGRRDHQVKIRGLRVELSEIENVLLRQDGVREVVVLAREDVPGRKVLVAYLTRAEAATVSPAELKAALRRILPEQMVPSAFVVMEALPLTTNGKVDRKLLPPPTLVAGAAEPPSRDAIEERLSKIVSEVLGTGRIGVNDGLFEIGASSLDVVKIRRRVESELDVRVPMTAFFEHPSIGALAAHIQRARQSVALEPSAPAHVAPQSTSKQIAIIGMAGRFPGAANVDELWRNVREGRDCLTRFDATRANPSPFVPEGTRHPRFVGVEGVLAATGVDAELWRPTAETRALDVQSRLFLDSVLGAFEDAGYDPWSFGGRVALYGGASTAPLVEDVVHRGLGGSGSALWARMTLAPETLPMRVAHTLGLRGEAMNVNTACSTGLSAVHLACQSLRLGQCEMAVAVAANVPSIQGTGYVWEEGTIFSADGVVRPFDASANGVVVGHGVGAVLLKPLDAALRDGDMIYAVVRGSATNNDGREKVGYTAPSVTGQVEVISAAHASAEVSANDIGYAETHGTGTNLGDPIELAALTKAFARSSDRTGYCALGAVKANVGHLDSAAGMVGLLKTALVLHHRTLPPVANFTAPNPEIRLESTPFVIPTSARAWDADGKRIASVSSFGIGGTNVHAVLEEAPARDVPAPPARGAFVLRVQARTEEALATTSLEIASLLESATPAEVADIVFTLDTRRLEWPLTRAVYGTDGPSLAQALRRGGLTRHASSPPTIAFVYTGMGANPAGAGTALYETEPVFRAHVDRSDAVLAAAGFEVRRALTEKGTSLTAGLFGAALFAFETALDALLASWGIRPSLVIGHSLGEYAAAVRAGVLAIDDALRIVAARCHAMDAMTTGAMLAVTSPPDQVREIAQRGGVEIAAFNGPRATVLSGAPNAIETLRKELRQAGIASVKLGVDRALHSKDVDPVVDRVVAAFSPEVLRAPSTRFVSTVTAVIDEPELQHPAYWGKQMRAPVKFEEAIQVARDAGATVFVEIGPTGGLVPIVAGLVPADAAVLPAFHAGGPSALYELLASLLERGARLDWARWYDGERRARVPVPLHPRPAGAPVFADAARQEPVATPANGATPAVGPAESVPAGASIEARVAELWKKALVLEAIDPRAHFLELGGSSLLAVQLVASMRDEFGVEMGLAEVFSAPTVESLAKLIATKKGLPALAAAKTPVPATAAPVGPRLPTTTAATRSAVSAVQRRVLAAHADREWGPVVVNMGGAVRIRGPLDTQRVARALREVIRRHEVLHTRVPERGGVPTLEIAFRSSDVQLASVWCDSGSSALEPASLDAQLEEVRSAIRERIGQPFDLAREIPIRAFVFHLGAGDQVLAIVAHHVAVDAPSLRIVLQDTLQSYLGVPLTGEAPKYSSFIERQAAEIEAGGEHLAAFEALFQRSARLRSLVESRAALRADTSLTFELGADIGQAISSLQKAGRSTFVVVAAALSLVVRDILDASELVVTTPFGNRDRSEHTNLVGYVAHCMVMLLDTTKTRADLLAEVDGAFREALAHATVPFEEMVLRRAPRQAEPLSDLCLVVHEEPEHAVRLGDLSVEAFPYETPGEEEPAAWVATMGTFGALVQLRPDGSGGRITFSFPRSVFGENVRTLPERLANALQRLAVSEAPAVSVAAVPTAAALESVRPPLALAVDGVALSYDELGALRTALASQLAAAGVKAASVVDVIYRNRAELVCLALALLDLGAYVTVGRSDAPLAVSLHAGDDGSAVIASDIVVGGESAPFGTLATLGRSRQARHDVDASPITTHSVKRALEKMGDNVGERGATVVWDDALADNRALPFALAALGARGAVIDLRAAAPSARAMAEQVPLSVAYFPVDEDSYGEDTYRLLLEGSKLADDAGLRAVFAPERHFHPFGGTYPDPLVAMSAVAGATKRVQLRAGSIVLPLHDPIRVAESWGMLDVLSGGRVGLSIATGWRADDFVLAPSMFARRKDALAGLLESLRALWRGESTERLAPDGRRLRVRTRPRPTQPELPVWLTCAGSPASFALAGELGMSVLTMITTDINGLAEGIRAYRRAFAKFWNGATGHVTVLVTTFVHDDARQAREAALAPLERYLSWSLDIGMKQGNTEVPLDVRSRFLRQKAERVIETDGLIGDIDESARRIEKLVAAGADEVACLVDFGIGADEVLGGIRRLGALAERAPKRASRWARLPAAVPLEHRGRPEVWLLSRGAAEVGAAVHRTVLVEDRHLAPETSPTLDEHPLSSIQFGVFFDELRFAKATYNNPFVIRSSTAFEPERLRHAIRAASSRHEMLRSRIVRRGEHLVRVVDEEPLVDLRVTEGCDDTSAVIAHATEAALERFDIGNAHPLRVHLYPSARGGCHLLLCLHHIAGDVVSGFLVVRDIAAAYNAFPADAWAEAASAPRYAEVAALRDTSHPERDARLARWVDHIAGAPTVIEWPTVRPRPARLSGEGRHLSRVVPKERVEALRAGARKCLVTIPTFLFAALQALLHLKTRRRDVLVGAVTLGRNDPARLEVVGPLFGMLPIRSTVEPGCSFAALAQRTGRTLMEGLVEDQISFADIVRAANVQAPLDRTALVQFLFNYIPKDGVGDGSGAGIEQVEVDWGTATFDVDVTARERGEELVLTVKWSRDALDDDEGARFMAAFDDLLACVTRDPQTVLLRPDAPVLDSTGTAFWKEELRDRPGGIALVDGRAPGVRGPFEQHRFAIPAATRQTLFGAFAVFLQRHAGQNDLVVASRTTTAVERRLDEAVGLPSAFAMVRVRIEGDPAFADFVEATMATEARVLSHAPVATGEAFAGEGSAIGVLFTHHDGVLGTHAPSPLPPRIALALDIDGASSTARFVYDTSCLGDALVQRFAARFVTLLESALAHPERKLSALDILPSDEVTALREWNATDAVYPRESCLHELVAEQAARTPDAVAVVHDAVQLTYAELDARADAFATQLRHAGVGTETRVGIALPRSAEMVVALLGVSKSGGAYVPIDLGLPKERVRGMLEDAGVTHLVAEPNAREILPETSATFVELDANAPASSPTSSVHHRVSADNLAYVIFTSGSTGRPKGVQVTHRALVNFLTSMQTRPGITTSDVLVAVTTLSFDIAGLELYLPLVTGARVVIASREATQTGPELARLLAASGATMLQATPTTYRLLLAAGWKGGPGFKALVGGEAVPPDLARELVLGCGSVWNMYGPTETTIWSTCSQLDGMRVVIGKPIANTKAYVLGPALEPVPIGTRGELYLSGDGLARGYASRDDLTAERFITNPFEPGARLYRTGDIARYLPDGNIECFGRVDSQIKLRGFRIELGEIEHALADSPALRSAVVLLREDVPGEARLIAYVVARSRTATLSSTELGDWLKASLPPYMIPSVFVVLDALPLNPSGKVDRRALAALDIAEHRAPTSAVYETPTNELESVLSAIWSEVLRVPKVGRNDNFFDLGGNSVLALQVHGKIVTRLGRDFPILNLFTYTTVGSLAAYLSKADAAPATRTRASTVSREALLEQGAQRRAQRKNRRVGGGGRS